jgi:Fur family zinc uptake transcriptional regulator
MTDDSQMPSLTTAQNDAMHVAEALCSDRGERLTPARRRVLELLLQAEGPIKAYDLLELLKPGPGAAKPPTVYRALDFLMELGLAHKIEALNAYVSCAHCHDSGGAEIFICTQCDGVEERHGASHSSCAPDGFTIQRSVVEHFGVCARCAA